MEYNKPIPVPSQESQPYWDGLREQKLMMPRCDDCKSYWFPLYAFIRRRGHDGSAAADLTQGFFTELLEKREVRA